MKALKIFFNYSVVILITLGLLELASWLLFARITGAPFERARLLEKRTLRLVEIEQKLSPQASQALYQFHPYTGYTGRPGSRPWKGSSLGFNRYGMLSVADHPYPYRKRSDEFVIAVVGGSVADLFANYGERPLQEIAKAQGIQRNIVLVNLATGGYKQPQQLFFLQYALLSGFEFDAVLNLDGFNDLVLARQNLDHGINPLFPSGHHMGLMSKLGGVPDPHTIQALAEYYDLYRREAHVLRLLNHTPLQYSVFFALVGEIWMKLSQGLIGRTEYQFTEEAQQDLAPAFRGPVAAGATQASVVQIWRQASELLYVTARSLGLTYLHVLQPNQYVKGSKPLSARELEIAWRPQNPWSRTVIESYTELMQTGAEMRAAGLPFFDLTDAFKDNTEDLYTDDCCHFGARGNAILAQRIFPLLLEQSVRQGKPLQANAIHSDNVTD